MDPWYFGNLSRVEAEERLLAHGKVGGYLVWNSHMIPGDVCLSILAGDAKPPRFHHLLLSLNNQNQYYIKSLPDNEMSFPSLSDLIAYYSVTDITFSDLHPPVKLTDPCPKDF